MGRYGSVCDAKKSHFILKGDFKIAEYIISGIKDKVCKVINKKES
jgi:hypothetical protein